MVEIGASRPSEQIPPQVIRQVNFEEGFSLLSEGKAVLTCGMSFTGREGYPTRIVSILRVIDDGNALEGWCFQHRYKEPEGYENEGFHRVDANDRSKVKLPDTMFAVVAEVDDSVVKEDGTNEARGLVNWANSLDDRLHSIPKV